MIRRSPAIVPGPRLERHPATTSAAATRPACLAQVLQHLQHGYLRGQDWRDMARHLVEAHGADSGSLIGYAPALEQLRFAEPATGIALASIGALPPGPHTHPLPVEAGWCVRRPESCRPQDWPAMLTTRRQAARSQDAPRRVDGCTALRGLPARPRKAGPARGRES